MKKARVLMVDDDSTILRIFRILIGDRYDVAVAHGGEEALASLAGEPGFDAIICDLTMPDLDGQGVYEALHDRAPAMCRRILFTSGGAYSPRLRGFVDRIAPPLLSKPFSADELVRAVERVLRAEAA